MAGEESVIDWKEINLQESRSELSRLDTPDGYPKAPSWALKTEFAHEYTSPLYGADPKMVEAALLGLEVEKEEDESSPLDASYKVLEQMRQQEEDGQEASADDDLQEADLDFLEEEEPAVERVRMIKGTDLEPVYPEKEEPSSERAEEAEEFYAPGEDAFLEEEEEDRQEQELLQAALLQEEEDDEAVLSRPEPAPMDLDAMLEEESETNGSFMTSSRELSFVEGHKDSDFASDSAEDCVPNGQASTEAREDTLKEIRVESEPDYEDALADAGQEEPETLEEETKASETQEEAEAAESDEEAASEEEETTEEEEPAETALEEEAEEAKAEEAEAEEAEASEEELETSEEDWLDEEDEEWDMQMPSFEDPDEEVDDLDFDAFFSGEEEDEVPIEAIEVEDTFKGLDSEEKPKKKSSPEKPVEEKKPEEKPEEASQEKAEKKTEEKTPAQKAKAEKSAPAKAASPAKTATGERKASTTRAKSARPGTAKASTKARRAATSGRSHMAGFIVGLVLLALGTAYAAVSYYYVDHFIPGTTINGISVAGLTAFEAEQAIAQNVEKYVISVASRNFETQEIAGSAIDYKYLSDGGVLNLMKHQNPLAWLFGYLHRTNYSAAKNVTFNKALLRSQLKSLDCARDENQVSPQNAYITMDGNTFSIVPETQGAELKMKEAYRILDEAISQGVKEIDFTSEAGVYEEATLTADSTAMHNMLDAFNNYATAKITLQFGNQKEILDGDILKNWLEFDDKGELVKDSSVFDQHIWNYIGQLAEKYDTVGTSRAVQATADGRTVYVYGYSYGWQIDQEAEFTQLQSEISQGLQVTREPNFSMRANAYWPNDIGNTYIEVDMGYQHMYYYQNGYLIFDSDFVSGNINIPGRATPEGIYTIYAKQSPAVLKGEYNEATGKPEYETEVSYWMPFNGGVGFHDADWQPYFGYDLYLTNGSHGCINLPYYAAAQLYEIIDYDVPILCFY